jgi:hypothetical protein
MSCFHVHVDATTLSNDFEERLIGDLEFFRNNFCGHPEGAQAFEPRVHLTRKVESADEFRRLFRLVEQRAMNPAAMSGYLEGEFVAYDQTIPEHSFDASVRPPFKLKLESLPAGTFRESEIHITLRRDSSDPIQLQRLLSMGLFAAYLPKSYGTAEIFTVQGSRLVITELFSPLIEYLRQAGGVTDCTIKEERIAAWWVSGSDVLLPPVVQAIEWLS